MKLSQTTIATIESLTQTALAAGIKKFVIADGKIRGIDDKQTVVIMSTNGVPDLEGKTLSINRVPELAARLNLVKSQGVSIEATVAQNGTDISVLDLSGGKTKAQFRCAALESVKGVPKNTNDSPAWEFDLVSSELPTIVQGVSAMSAETLAFTSKDGGVLSVEVFDSNKDLFSTELGGAVRYIADDAKPTSFARSYSSKALLALLKEAFRDGITSVRISIGANGILSLTVASFTFCMLPSTM